MEIGLFENLFNIFESYKKLIIGFGSISLILFIFSLLSIKWLVALIPEDYFLSKKNTKFKSNFPLLWIFIMLIKNIFGYSLIVGGIFMLVLPGQGLFTIFIGLMLSNYPGKYYIEKRFIAIPSVLQSINWLRSKSNKPPLKV